jgi:hypothetical protein
VVAKQRGEQPEARDLPPDRLAEDLGGGAAREMPLLILA